MAAIIIEVFRLAKFFALVIFLALLLDAHCENDVPCTIDHAINIIPRINGMALLAFATTPFSPVVKLRRTKIPTEVTKGNRHILKRYRFRVNIDISSFVLFSSSVIQLLIVLLFANNAVIAYEADRLVNAIATETFSESTLAVM